MIKKLLTLILGFSLSFASLANENAFSKDGMGTAMAMDIGVNLDELQQIAEKGNSDAQVMLGIIEGNNNHPEKMRVWLNKAIAKGNISALEVLADSYEHGSNGLERDWQKSLEFRLKLAEKGDYYHQYRLADNYYRMNDFKKAMQWALKSGNQGYSRASNLIAEMYHLGKGVPKDDITAIRWLELAVTQAQNFKNPTQDPNVMQGAEMDLTFAYQDLGEIYFEQQNYAQAKIMFEKAITPTNYVALKAYANLATIYEKGLGIPKNPAKAKELRKQACEFDYQTTCEKLKL